MPGGFGSYVLVDVLSFDLRACFFPFLSVVNRNLREGNVGLKKVQDFPKFFQEERSRFIYDAMLVEFGPPWFVTFFFPFKLEKVGTDTHT